MLERFKKLIKRKIRESQKFKKNKLIKIVGISSNTLDFIIDIIRTINNKYKLNLELDLERYKYIEEVVLKEDGYTLLVIPAEAVITSFILDFADISNDYRWLIYEKTKKYFNVAYWVSEYYISKYLNKDPKRMFKSYRQVENFVYFSISRNEKHINATLRIISYLSNFCII
ncbi:MAG TPA: hypothetical protein EYH09_01395 [Candidatus Nanopusillus sp.]|nr:hypothetical protein [Candidatus Nanopusillus sp.]